jgi:hypothetical protein
MVGWSVGVREGHHRGKLALVCAMPATTPARRVRDGVLTLACLAVLTPVLVLGMAAVGLAPRHWSGVPLGGVELPFIDLNPYHGGTRPDHLDAVTDALAATEEPGWVAVVGGSDGRVYVEVTQLNSAMFTLLGDRFGDDAVGLIYSPFTPPVHLDNADPASAETWWQRTDPPGTWVTLLFGFPWAIAAGLVLTVLGWTLIVRRRRSKAKPGAISTVSS